jgi:hypothetical protein
MPNLKSAQPPLEPWCMENGLIIFLPFLLHPLPFRVLTSTSVSSINTVTCPSRREPDLLMVLKASVPTRTYLTSVIPEFKSYPGVQGSRIVYSLHNYLRLKLGTNLPEEHSTFLDWQKLLILPRPHPKSITPSLQLFWSNSGSVNIIYNALGRG